MMLVPELVYRFEIEAIDWFHAVEVGSHSCLSFFHLTVFQIDAKIMFTIFLAVLHVELPM